MCPVEETVGGPLKLLTVQPVRNAQRQKATTADAKRCRDVTVSPQTIEFAQIGSPETNA
jgi:hypothetical protein